jgi:propanol-preferring alcohol dehydrogenase
MKAMVLEKPGPIESNPLVFRDVPEPEPGPCQVRLKVKACGLCRTDLHTIEGELPVHRSPLIPGHQIVGIVDKLGEGTTKHRLGDRLGVPWLHWTCGECRYCRKGKENMCENAKFTGYDVDGGYAQFMTVHEDFTYPIPEGFDDFHATPLLCGGIIGYRALRLSEIAEGGTLGLYGFGNSAHIAIQVAKHWGCTVYVFSRTEDHLEHARALGADWTGGAEETPPTPLDSAVIFAPAGPVVHEALRVLDKGGTISLAGIYMTPIPEMDYGLIYHEKTLRSVANSTRQDVRELLDYAGTIPIRTDVEVFDLEDANEALRRVKHSQVNGDAVLRIPE